MTFPPPRICQRMRALHALIGSSNANEADSARQKLNKLLAEYGLSWNDLPSILAAIDSNANSASTAPEPPREGPAVNVLDLVLVLIEQHVAISPEERLATALWVLHTYIFDRYTITPRLVLRSPVRGCGKTTLLVLLDLLSAEPFRVDSVSAAAIYHQLDHRPRSTLLVDEADNLDLFSNGTLRSVFNSGHRRGGA